MKRYIKISLMLILLLTISIPIANPNVNAKTFGELKKELATQESNLQANKQKQKLTSDQMNAIQTNINTTMTEIQTATNEIQSLNNQIIELNNKIIEKEKQIKSIMNFTQISSGESEYLEYLFGAADFTDFIYRVAIAEQLTKYNNDLVNEYNATIEENKKKTEELAQKQIDLANKQKSLEAQLQQLGSQLDDVIEDQVDIESQIKYLKELVQIYEDRDCQDDEDITTCGLKKLPVSTVFYRPLANGVVTSNFGPRNLSVASSNYHYGVDLSTSIASGEVNVYASGAGVVSGITSRSSCGGNIVYIHHKTANGTTYTTIYMHLHYVYVSVDQVVTSETVIGTMGGNRYYSSSPGYTPWDTCTTGAHLHFQVATGLYGIDYSYWSSLLAHSFNPRNFINLPTGSWWSNRTTAY